MGRHRKKEKSIRFRLPVRGGSYIMIKRAAVDYFSGMPDVMKVTEVAEILRCSKNTLYEFIHMGRLEVLRKGRNMLVPKHILVDFVCNERLYYIISPNAPKNILQNSWTSGKSCGMLCGADKRTNAKSTVKGAR